MKVVIIEDEELVAEDLHSILLEIDPNIELMGIIGSVGQAVSYFSSHDKPDLIFSDIHLGDGLSLEIYSRLEINVPIIFCTAYDNYAIQAFQANGIDYILKPYDRRSIERSIEKFKTLKAFLAKDIIQHYETVKNALETYRLRESSTYMIRYRDRFIPVALDKIVLFYVENDLNRISLSSGKTYLISDTLEDAEKVVGNNFFRANRQFLVNRIFVEEAIEYFPRKMKVVMRSGFEREIIVSKEKRPKLIQWLNEI